MPTVNKDCQLCLSGWNPIKSFRFFIKTCLPPADYSQGLLQMRQTSKKRQTIKSNSSDGRFTGSQNPRWSDRRRKTKRQVPHSQSVIFLLPGLFLGVARPIKVVAPSNGQKLNCTDACFLMYTGCHVFIISCDTTIKHGVIQCPCCPSLALLILLKNFLITF